MDRKTIYAGQVPLETDLLNAEQFAMVALGELAQSVFGTPTLVDNFTVTPTVPASLNVVLTPGNIYQLENLEATTWSSLPANITNSIVKQGIQLNPVTFGITPPGTTGYSQCFLVEVQYQDLDTGSTVLPYFNASNPSVPFSGPGNAGTAQNTIRQGVVAAQIKAGTAQPTGAQQIPTPDAGWTGIYVVTVANGAASITSGNIQVFTSAPFLALNGHLPQIPTGVQNSTWTFSNDTSPGGTPPTTSASTATSSAILTFSSVPSWIISGMKAFDLTTPGAITGGQTVLSVTSTTVTLSANVNATVNSGDTIAFSNNAMVSSILPVPTVLTAGLTVRIKSSGTNTGPATLNLNGLGAVAIHRANGANLQAGDISANMVVEFIYDGSAFQMANFEGFTSTTTNNNTSIISIPYATDTGAVNTLVTSYSPAISSLFAGLTIEVKVGHTNTSAVTIAVNSLAVQNVVDSQSQALTAGMLFAGQVALLIYDGTNFQLANVRNLATQAFTLYVNGGSGSDSNNGLTSGTAFATIQKAFNVAAQYAPGPNAITINVASWASHYPGAATATWLHPQLILNGAGAGNTIIDNSSGALQGSNGSAIIAFGGNTITVQNCTFSLTTLSGVEEDEIIDSMGVMAYGSGSTINIGSGCAFGPAIFCLAAVEHGVVNVQNSFSVAAGGACHGVLYCEDWGLVYISPVTITITAAMTVANGFAITDDFSCIQVATSGSVTFTNPGNVTGPKFLAGDTGIIETNGGGANFFPGSTAGTTGSTSLYS